VSDKVPLPEGIRDGAVTFLHERYIDATQRDRHIRKDTHRLLAGIRYQQVVAPLQAWGIEYFGSIQVLYVVAYWDATVEEFQESMSRVLPDPSKPLDAKLAMQTKPLSEVRRLSRDDVATRVQKSGVDLSGELDFPYFRLESLKVEL
jgi:hypothetical protein